jgi:hypothetical protein
MLTFIILLKISKEKTLRKKAHATGIEPTSLWFGTFSLTDCARDVLFKVATLLLMVYSYMENFN